MNDQIKLLVAGAVIALAGVAAGGIIVGWARDVVKSEELRVKSGVASGQLTVGSGQPLVFNGQGVQPNPAFRSIVPAANVPQVRFPTQFITPPGTANASGGRPQPINSAAFQKVQEVPEVKAARGALIEAQKKYTDAMQKAMGQPAGSGQFSVNSGQKSVVSGQPSAGIGAVANTAKITPLTIQIPPAATSTNGTAKAKL